jgi:hypothetical protein
MDFDDKLSAVVCRCKTPAQLDCSLVYAKLALKAGLIGQYKYHFAWGTINALKAVINSNEEAKS